jgi:asparagine synthase (glutamine-hydrolysing)
MLGDGRARLRGVAANSFGPWIPRPLLKMLSPLSAAAAAQAQDALHARYAQRLRREQAAGDLARAQGADYFQTAIDAFSEMDFGEYRKGILGGWGIDKRDATADRRLIEFCLSLPLEMLISGGARRPLAKAALSDRLPAEVLSETRKGYQGADWGLALSAGRADAERLVEQMAADPVASDIIDIAHLRTLLQEWPTGDWADRRLIARYRVAFLLALSAGQFILNAKRPAAAQCEGS